MKLYDNLIENTLAVLSGAANSGDAVSGAGSVGATSTFAYDEARAWKCLENSEFIMQRDACIELGGSGKPSVNYTLVTTSGIADKDEILVYGKDISQVPAAEAFARIVILETDDLGEDTDKEKAFQAIRNLEFVRYHVFPEGYMVRVSSQSNQEQVRISTRAKKQGISFESVGSAYIKKYKEVPCVKHVKMIFVTDEALVSALRPNADKVDAITRTLTSILDGMPTDCGHCSMKSVCDEVEGMKELHLGKKR